MCKYIVTHGIRIAKDFVPETFGRLTTLGPKFWMSTTKDSARPQVVCLCACGEVCAVAYRNMTNGHTKSCGCLHKEQLIARTTVHGLSGTATYYSYFSMLARCYDVKHKSYIRYGGRGICVFPDWRDPKDGGYVRFFGYMGECPYGKTLDRFPDPNGNYEPGNVRWATDEEQANNRRPCRHLTHNGETLTMAQWERKMGLGESTISSRLGMGWTVAEAIETPRKQPKLLTHNDKTQSITAWAKEIGMPRNVLSTRF